jgi:hypothetical protein
MPSHATTPVLPAEIALAIMRLGMRVIGRLRLLGSDEIAHRRSAPHASADDEARRYR